MLGWNEQTQKGEFTGDFTNQTKGQTITQTFISEGADVIFPVAGNVGLGAAKAVQQADASGGKVNMEWVDVDGCVSAAQYCKYFLTSVTKGIATAVQTAVTSAQSGSFKGGTYVGTLANGGAVLSPFHDFATVIPASLQAELKTIQAGIERRLHPDADQEPGLSAVEHTWNLSSGASPRGSACSRRTTGSACRWPLARSTPSSARTGQGRPRS